MTMTETDNYTGTGSSTDGRGGRLSGARTKASDAYYAARERTSSAYGSARDGASRARQKTSEGIDANPVAALIGGLALGGLLAAILPKTRREEEMLGDYSRQINSRAREAARAAKEAGTSKLDELGYNKENAKQKFETLRSDFADIAGAAAQRLKGDAREVASAAAQEAKSTSQQ
ncbi:MAG TPA: hypothetical protein VGD10_08975 [Allosphingosinicella sp.]|uniref:hypothetical protein n=1 Tax=Allosphingosinicella sp. TaxID=2823234 RepID=UPI002EDAAB6C